MNNSSTFDADRRLALFVTGLSLLQPNSTLHAQDRGSANAPRTQTRPILLGKWGRSTSYYPTAGIPTTRTAGGYTRRIYDLLPNGSYTYTQRSWSLENQYIIIAREVGKFSATDDSLTLKPAANSITAYKKNDGSDWLGDIAKKQELALETVAYTYSFHYFQRIQQWNLVLQAAQETRRDGRFTATAVFRNAWLFDQQHVDIDLLAPRVR